MCGSGSGDCQGATGMGPADRPTIERDASGIRRKTIIRNISPAKVKYFTRKGDANPFCQMVIAPKFAKIPRELMLQVKDGCNRFN